MFLSKKTVFIILLLAVAVAVLLSFFINTNSLSNKTKITYEMVNITVKEVKEGMIIADGKIRSTQANIGENENKKITFLITSKTTFKKNILTATAEQIEGGSFKPKTEIVVGSFSDIVSGIKPISIKSKENLFKVDKANALEINYIIYNFDYPTFN